MNLNANVRAVLRVLRRRCSAVTLTLSICVVTGAPPAAAQVEVLGERVIGGHDSAPDAWPYQAYIQMRSAKGTAACGGTLIAPDWVLTAAHCVMQDGGPTIRAAASFSVRLGSAMRSQGGEMHTVSRVIAHETYSARFSLENDIALLQLAEPSRLAVAGIEDSSTSRAVAPNATPWAKVVGWGLTNVAQSIIPERLQEASLPLIQADQCNAVMGAMFPKAGPIDKRRICAGSSEGGIDSCNGDSGGPLLVSDGRSGWVQVGIVSYGVTDCGRAKAYGVYTRVGSFAEWIARHIGTTKAPQASGPAVVKPIALGVTAAAPSILASAAKEGGPVRVAISRRRLALGDKFQVNVTSAFDGYLALFDLNADNGLTQIFPNPRSALANKNGVIRAGAPLRLPDPSYGFAFEASEPRGRGRLLAIVSSDPSLLTSLVSRDGFTALDDAAGRMERLELVLKSSSPSKQWAAGLTDYIVE